jgi:hypothetical protein
MEMSPLAVPVLSPEEALDALSTDVLLTDVLSADPLSAAALLADELPALLPQPATNIAANIPAVIPANLFFINFPPDFHVMCKGLPSCFNFLYSMAAFVPETLP